MNPWLQSAKQLAVSNLVLPSQRFFTPTEEFWEMLSTVPEDVQIIDCGTGNGELVQEARDRGFNLRGIDLFYRDGRSPLVEFGDATTFKWSPQVWPMFCRPSHDGWVEETVVRARNSGATSIYVGLKSNFFIDIGSFRAKRHPEQVGVEREYWYTINARFDRT